MLGIDGIVCCYIKVARFDSHSFLLGLTEAGDQMK